MLWRLAAAVADLSRRVLCCLEMGRGKIFLQVSSAGLCSSSMRANLFLSSLAAAAALCVSSVAFAERPPDTPRKPVTTEYHGLRVEDPYQWLENDDDSQVKAWSNAQNQRTRKYLDSLSNRASIEKQLSEWYAKTSPSYFSLV